MDNILLFGGGLINFLICAFLALSIIMNKKQGSDSGNANKKNDKSSNDRH